MSKLLEIELKSATTVLSALDCSRALTISLLIQYEEWEQLVGLDCNPLHYDNVGGFQDAYLATSLLRKSPNLPLKVDRAAVALQSFLEAEEKCRRTNNSLKASRDPELRTLLFKVSHEMKKMMGDLNGFALRYIEKSFSHGPGSVIGVSGMNSVLSDKYDKTNLTLTCSLYPFARSICGSRWMDALEPSIVLGNRFTTVPKSAKTDRGICVEPMLNMYVQKGIGAYLKKRLAFSSNPIDSQDRNRELVKEAFASRLATIDLSMASDTISYNLIEEVLDPAWFRLLESCRSPFTELPDGTFLRVEKFSSMGNAFTFELETLLFLAIVRAVLGDDVAAEHAVFGDDIIVPQAHAEPVVAALSLLGFEVNTSKSFLAGSFFESCGSDYFRGFNVRPFFLKRTKLDTLDSIPYSLQIVNCLRLYAERTYPADGCDPRLRDAWRRLVRQVPKSWRNPVPAILGDVGLITDKPKGIPRAPWGNEGYKVKFKMVKPVRRCKMTNGLLLLKLAYNSSSPASMPLEVVEPLYSKNVEPVRGLHGKVVQKSTLVPSWGVDLQW